MNDYIKQARRYLDLIPDELRGSPNDLVSLLKSTTDRLEELEKRPRVIDMSSCESRVRELESDRVGKSARIEELEAALEVCDVPVKRQRKRIERLEDALRYYAREDSWSKCRNVAKIALKEH